MKVCIIAEINKDLTKHSVGEIEKHLNSVGEIEKHLIRAGSTYRELLKLFDSELVDIAPLQIRNIFHNETYANRTCRA